MRFLFLVFVLFLAQNAYASENWLCTEAGITREGNTFISCGMGNGYSESTARDRAFYQAKHEFTQLCEIDSDCKKRKITVEPGRTSCEEISKHNFQCYRLIRFTVR